MPKTPLLILSHLLFAAAGFAAGIYLLPVLTAPPAPTAAAMASAIGQAKYSGQFRRDLRGSDFLHWGEGDVSVGDTQIALNGAVAPGPDYRLYLSPRFVENEAEVLAIKPQMAEVGMVKSFENFIVPVPKGIDPAQYNTVLVWCEAFGEFISAAKYQ